MERCPRFSNSITQSCPNCPATPVTNTLISTCSCVRPPLPIASYPLLTSSSITSCPSWPVTPVTKTLNYTLALDRPLYSLCSSQHSGCVICSYTFPRSISDTRRRLLAPSRSDSQDTSQSFLRFQPRMSSLDTIQGLS